MISRYSAGLLISQGDYKLVQADDIYPRAATQIVWVKAVDGAVDHLAVTV
jgi:hypothetical protein